MKRRFVCGILLLCLLLSVLAATTSASASILLEDGASIYDAVQGQDLTGATIDGFVPQWQYQDLIYFMETQYGYYGIMDVYGNVIFAPRYKLAASLGDGYAVFGMSDEKLAIFYKTNQLTSFSYSEITGLALCIRAKNENGSYVFFDRNGKTISVPTVANKDWYAVDLIPGKAIVLKKAASGYYDEYLGGYVVTDARYQVVDWQGNPITSKIYDTEIYIQDENSFIITNGNYAHMYLDGSTDKTRPRGFQEVGGISADTQYRILYQEENSIDVYYLYDAQYNPICKLETSSTYASIKPISSTLFILRNADDSYVLMNASAEVVAELPGGFYTFTGSVRINGSETPATGFVVGDGENSYLYDMEGKQIAVLEGATSPKSEGYYISASIGEMQYRLYDLQGNVLYDYSRFPETEIRNGVILEERGGNNGCAVLDKNGEPLTDYIFYSCQTTEIYGLIRAQIIDREGYFLVNAAGEVLNPIGFEDFPSIQGSYCYYSINGKLGIMRIVMPGDSLFIDVPYGTWYYDAVEYCAENGLFAGTAVAKFSPENAMTRAMLVSVLWRLDGKPAPTASASFADVPTGSWYAEAVAWAAENEIVFGVGEGKFAPDDNITREQIAAIMLRYAKKKGYDTQEMTEISGFADASRVSSYAVEAIQWANAVGILSGSKEGSQLLLLPQDNATRAQLASILMRFVQNIVEG